MGIRAKRAVKPKWRLGFLIELLMKLQRQRYRDVWETAIYSHSGDYVTPLNDWLQEASQQVINHFTRNVTGKQLLQTKKDRMQDRFGGSEVCSKCPKSGM